MKKFLLLIIAILITWNLTPKSYCQAAIISVPIYLDGTPLSSIIGTLYVPMSADSNMLCDTCFPIQKTVKVYMKGQVATATAYHLADSTKGALNTAAIAAINTGMSAIPWTSVTGKPSFATVATTGVYSDLSGKPTIPAAQVQSDWSQSNTGISDYVKNKPVLLTKGYEGTAARNNIYPAFKTATVSSGAVNIYLTDDNTSTGNAIFPNGIITSSVNFVLNDATAAYQIAWVFTNSNKTVAVTVNKLGTANLLTGILGQAAANGISINLSVWGY